MILKEILHKGEKKEIETNCNYIGNMGYLVLTDKRILFEIRFSGKYSKIFHVSDYNNINFINIAEAAFGKSIVLNTKHGEYEFSVSKVPEVEKIMEIIKDRKGEKKYISEQNIRNMSYLNKKTREKAAFNMIYIYILIIIGALALGCWFIRYIFETIR